jgi:cysteine-S-conjugate beta-lyase
MKNLTSLAFDFDTPIDRRDTDSLKWGLYPPDVLPLWVADMDFACPTPILHAIRQRLEHPVLGYSTDLPELKQAICERFSVQQGWEIDPLAIVLLPGLVSGLNVVCRAYGDNGSGVLVNTPIYPPFLSAPGNQQRQLVAVELACSERNSHLHYEIDFDALEAAVTPETRLFLLCSPQNPTGRVFSREELLAVADFCDRHDLVLCSDEIHADLLLGGNGFYSISALSREIEQRTVTLIAPSKTFNIPTLGCSAAIVTDRDLRRSLKKAAAGIVSEVGALSQHAGVAAYTRCEEWLEELRRYLTANRDFAVKFIVDHLKPLRCTSPEGTYLLWIDCRPAELPDSPFKFFLDNARVALNDGRRFGPGGEGFVRLNFACPRSRLEEALERMRKALSQRVG